MGAAGGGGGAGGGEGRRPITACKPLQPNQRKNSFFTIGDPVDDASTTQWLGGSRTRKFLYTFFHRGELKWLII